MLPSLRVACVEMTEREELSAAIIAYPKNALEELEAFTEELTAPVPTAYATIYGSRLVFVQDHLAVFHPERLARKCVGPIRCRMGARPVPAAHVETSRRTPVRFTGPEG